MKKLINTKFFKSFISKVPLITLLLITISTNYYYFFSDSYSKYYSLISYCSGFSILSLPGYFFIVYKFNFCMYSKVALWGVAFYVIFNVLDFFVKFGEGFYRNVFEAGTLTIVLALSIWYLILKNNRIKWTTQ